MNYNIVLNDEKASLFIENSKSPLFEIDMEPFLLNSTLIECLYDNKGDINENFLEDLCYDIPMMFKDYINSNDLEKKLDLLYDKSSLFFDLICSLKIAIRKYLNLNEDWQRM